MVAQRVDPKERPSDNLRALVDSTGNVSGDMTVHE